MKNTKINEFSETVKENKTKNVQKYDYYLVLRFRYSKDNDIH